MKDFFKFILPVILDIIFLFSGYAPYLVVPFLNYLCVNFPEYSQDIMLHVPIIIMFVILPLLNVIYYYLAYRKQFRQIKKIYEFPLPPPLVKELPDAYTKMRRKYLRSKFTLFFINLVEPKTKDEREQDQNYVNELNIIYHKKIKKLVKIVIFFYPFLVFLMVTLPILYAFYTLFV